MVPDITGGVMCMPKVPESQPAMDAAEATDATDATDNILPCTSFSEPMERPSGEKDQDKEAEEEQEKEEVVKEDREVHEDIEEDDNELGASCSEKRLSTESGYGASDKLLDAMEIRDLSQSEIPPDRLSLPPQQTEAKLANRDSGIDSISSPSHSEELCFAGDDREVCMSLPRLSSSSSCGCVDGPAGEGAVAAAEEGTRDSEGDSDLEEGSGDESENAMAIQPQPKAERQDSVEVRLVIQM